MKRFGMIGLLLAFLGLFTACNNFSFQNPIGVPSIVVSIGDSSLTQDEATGNWKLAFTLEARTLPGSPGGVILEFDLDGGGTLEAGRRVERCPATNAEPCGPFTTNYELEFTSYPPAGSYVVVGYRVMGENGAWMHVRMPQPLKIH